MAVRISSADSIRRAILADALLREIFEKVEVNTTGLAPIAYGPSVGILGIPTINDFEAEWKLNVIGLTDAESDQVANALSSLFPGAAIKFSSTGISVRIFSLATKSVLESLEEQKKIQADEERAKKLEQAIDYASKLSSGQDGQQGVRGEQGLRGDRGEMGPPGPAGRDGKDLLATEAELNDLLDVFVPDPKIGHVLTWDGAGWVPRFVPQVFKYAGGGAGGGGGGDVEEAPQDGRAYVRRNGEWLSLDDALNLASSLDAGDFDSGTSNPNQLYVNPDAGSFD